MKVADGVELLKFTANIMGEQSVCLTLIWDERDVILVDAGYPGIIEKIKTAFEEASVPFDRLTKIIVTHHDIDHIGSLSAVVQEVPGLEVLAHEEEKPYIQGELPPIKMSLKSASDLDSLPEEVRRKIIGAFENLSKQKVNVDRVLSDGEELPFCGGITVIHLPGHTPGHIGLYHRSSKTLIAGDALFVENSRLTPSPDLLNVDTDLAINSLKKLAQYDIAQIICCHGGLYTKSPNQSLIKLTNNSEN